MQQQNVPPVALQKVGIRQVLARNLLVVLMLAFFALIMGWGYFRPSEQAITPITVADAAPDAAAAPIDAPASFDTTVIGQIDASTPKGRQLRATTLCESLFRQFPERAWVWIWNDTEAVQLCAYSPSPGVWEPKEFVEGSDMAAITMAYNRGN